MHSHECYEFLSMTVKINNILRFRSIRVVVRVAAEFTRQVEDDTQHVQGSFTLRPQHVASGHYFDFHELTNEMSLSVDNFNARGSGYVLDHITDCIVVISRYRPLAGSTYIPTPSSTVIDRAQTCRH